MLIVEKPTDWHDLAIRIRGICVGGSSVLCRAVVWAALRGVVDIVSSSVSFLFLLLLLLLFLTMRDSNRVELLSDG